MSLADAALLYARRGWPIIPLHNIDDAGQCSCGRADCESAGKHPRCARGVHDATTDVQQISEWWQTWPNANIGVVTGSESQLVVIDIDPAHGGEQSVAAWSLPPTLTQRTGRGGTHYVYVGNHPMPSRVALAPGVDVRADGGYIVVAPSRTTSLYCWTRWCDPAPLPPWLADAIRQPRAVVSPTTQTRWQRGVRNRSLFAAGCALRRRGLSYDAIHAALRETNRAQCDPPLTPREVEQIARSCCRYQPIAGEDREYLAELHPLSEIVPMPLRWLWPGRIPCGKVTLIAGDPGLGKSLLSLDVAARVSRGGRWPDWADRPQTARGVVLLSAEDDPADTLRPRLDAAGADVSRITLLRAVRRGRRRGSFRLDADIPALDEAIVRTPDCALVVVDPILAYIGDADAHHSGAIRQVLTPLADVAVRRGVAIVCVTHLNKGVISTLHRIIGSISFTAVARACWLVQREGCSSRRLMVPMKSNLSADTTAMAFWIESASNGSPYIAWEPEPLTEWPGMRV